MYTRYCDNVQSSASLAPATDVALYMHCHKYGHSVERDVFRGNSVIW